MNVERWTLAVGRSISRAQRPTLNVQRSTSKAERRRSCRALGVGAVHCRAGSPLRVSRRCGSSGFTFVEVLIALLVAVILVSVACTSLITSLKAEQISDWQRDASFLMNQLVTEARLGIESTGVVTQVSADWEITSDDIEVGSEPDVVSWRVWILYPRERPSLTVTFSARL